MEKFNKTISPCYLLPFLSSQYLCIFSSLQYLSHLLQTENAVFKANTAMLMNVNMDAHINSQQLLFYLNMRLIYILHKTSLSLSLNILPSILLFRTSFPSLSSQEPTLSLLLQTADTLPPVRQKSDPHEKVICRSLVL